MNWRPSSFLRMTVLLIVLSLVLLAPAAPGLAAGPITAQANTYIVEDNADLPDSVPGNGVCRAANGKCTLRAAIDEANADGVPSTINFAKRFQGPDGFSAYAPIPALTKPGTTIDGSSQWDTTLGRPGVEIGAALGATALWISSDSNTIMGILFAGSGSGIRVNAGGNTIGGTGAGQRNVFLTGTYGIWVSGGSSNAIVGNYFGTANGASAPMAGQTGIYIQGGSSNTLRDNLIVNQLNGVYISGNNHLITDNIIGLTWNKATALPNDCGILLYGGQDITVGPNNVVAGNRDEGVYVWSANNSIVTGNWIGYGSNGNGGDGVSIREAENVTVTDNIITANAGHGIYATFTYSSSNNRVTIQGNTIGAIAYGAANGSDGIYFDAETTGTIGGSAAGQRNIIGGNVGNGIYLDGSSNVTIAGNWIGLDSAGAYDNGNTGNGILVTGSNNTIGGTGAGAGNWIAYNHQDGILITGSGATNNVVVGNVLGAPINWGWAAGNGHHGIALYNGARGNWVGNLAGGNTVLASGWSGVAIVGSSGNFIMLNKIGTDGAGHNWGNSFYGVAVGNGTDNYIGHNEVAQNGTHSGEEGVRIDGATATGNAIDANSIHDNGGAGINLLNGGNGGLAAPIISAAACGGSVSGTACPNCKVQIFSDSGDEGRVYHIQVNADAAGAFSWSGALAGPNITATATDAASNTSAFSAPFAIGVCNTAPIASFTVTPSSGTPSTVFQFDASGCSDNEEAAATLQVRWDWENDGTYDTDWSTTKTASHSYGAIALYTVRLQVRDSGGLTGETTRQVSVVSQPPPSQGSTLFLP
ncbi:MAG: right-handed parallel beta-helix repeat-containing protein, partial [Anaerolineae bacterium]